MQEAVFFTMDIIYRNAKLVFQSSIFRFPLIFLNFIKYAGMFGWKIEKSVAFLDSFFPLMVPFHKIHFQYVNTR